MYRTDLLYFTVIIRSSARINIGRHEIRDHLAASPEIPGQSKVCPNTNNIICNIMGRYCRPFTGDLRHSNLFSSINYCLMDRIV